ncbi:MAG: hypothetical protein ACM37U_10820 [Gemmatimonas sp.]
MADIVFIRLRPYWFPLSSGFGIGVTAGSEGEARSLAESARLQHFPDAEFTGFVPDINIATLDPTHVVPRIGPRDRPGVWFPRSTA